MTQQQIDTICNIIDAFSFTDPYDLKEAKVLEDTLQDYLGMNYGVLYKGSSFDILDPMDQKTYTFKRAGKLL